jgi:serine/threonine protein kinase
MAAGCPAPEDLDDLAAGALAATRAEQVRDHLDECSLCRIALGQLAQSTAAPKTPASRAASVGQIGRYKIVRKLGAGGMGVALLAEDGQLQRSVVIKLLHLDASANPESRQRLLREAQAMAQVSHPNVVPIFDVGVHHEQVFIAMAYLDGGDLAGWLATPRPLREVLDVFVAAGRGLAAAHRAGLVHRDFKPANVLLGGGGEVKVSDFGLARAGSATEPEHGERLLEKTITQVGAIVGTPYYMAPEQLLGDPVGARADQYSFCLALYEAVSGHKLRPATNIAQLLDVALAGDCPDQPLLERGVPVRARAAIRRGLANDPNDRFESMEALHGELVDTDEMTSNRYTILGRLAGGGMADIFLARATAMAGLERHVVLKRVRAELSSDPHFARMFLDEARLAAQLHHPNIAQVYDIGRLGGAYFFTMEYVHGADLRSIGQVLASEGRPMPVALALHIAAGALAALHHAHDRVGPDGQLLGIVHRDVSPSNVMVAYEGTIKLVDFGVAKATQNKEETVAGSLKGKISYLSPEQIRNKPVDRRSDIFSLGIILYELLTGARLFRRGGDLASMGAILNEEVPPPSTRRPEISPELDAIVMRALQKDRERRYPTAADMLEAIERLGLREQHLLSSTAMSRFLTELLGERPLPWLELDSFDDPTMMVAAEIESGLDSDVATAVTRRVAHGEIEALLNSAPPIGRPWAPSHTPPSAEVKAAVAVSPVARAARPPAKAIQTFVVLGALAVVGIAVAIWQPWASDPGPRVEPEVVRMEVAAADAHVDEPLAVQDASVAAATPMIDAMVELPSPPRPTIADAVAHLDWGTALERCVASAQLSPAEHADCGVAACETRQRAAALSYYRGTPTAARARVERSCLQRGIELVHRSRRPTGNHPTDPCDEKPLECQK